MSETSGNDSPFTGRQHGAGTYQMLWDCRFCGTEKLLGLTHRHCPNCGAAQDPAWRYFPAEGDMVAAEDHEYVGADRICPACEQPNSAAATFCVACGANLETGEIAETQGVRALGTAGAAADTQRDVVKESFQAEMARVESEERAQPVLFGLTKTQLIVAGVVVLAVAILGAIVFALTYRQSGAGTVSALHWERAVEVEQLSAVGDEAWRELVPGDAYGLSCRERQRDTRQVAVGSHEECRDVDQGDGSFRRECETITDYESEPVYDSWCTYTVDRWVVTRTESLDGADEPPLWPQLQLQSGSGLGSEREGAQHEVYSVVVKVEGEEHTCEFDDLGRWQAFDVGQSVTLETRLDGSVDCGSLEPS